MLGLKLNYVSKMGHWSQELWQGEVYIEFELREKNRYWNEPQARRILALGVQ